MSKQTSNKFSPEIRTRVGAPIMLPLGTLQYERSSPQMLLSALSKTQRECPLSIREGVLSK